MGFLQADSQNIILDCVLTDNGRKFLSRNDGSFSIVKFAVSDEEVSYDTIQKVGRTIGKERIEKLTPIFEALTNGAYAQKYRCISVSNPNLIKLPNLQLQGEGVDTTGTIISIGNTTVKRRSITIFQNITNEQTIDVELVDQTFIVECHNLFIQILGSTPDHIDSNQRASYILLRDASTSSIGGSKLTLTIATKAILESQFSIYGARSNKNLISSFIKIAGLQSGATKEIEIQITKTS